MEIDKTELLILLINRHKGKLLSKLEQVNAPEIYIDTINKEFHFIIKDIKENNYNFNYKCKVNDGNTK